MKYIYPCILLLFLACNSNEKKTEATDTEPTGPAEQTIKKEKEGDPDGNLSAGETYSNEAFQEVTVERIDKYTFLVEGKARLFEGTYSWVIEDGHRELREGFGTTTAGAPAWGRFSFTVEALKENPNTVLHLILFESSAKDGSRQHQLMIPLY